MVVESKLDLALHLLDGVAQTRKDGLDTATLLHGDDAELILLIHPHKEGLVVVVEDTTAGRPVTVGTSSSKETVTFLEQKVVVNELLALLFRERLQGVVLPGKIAFESAEALGHTLLDFLPLGLADERGKRHVLDVATDTHPGGNDELVLLIQGLVGNLVRVEVTSVLGILGVAVIGLDQRVEKGTKSAVRLLITTIHTNTGVRVLHTTVHAALESKARSSLLVLELFKDLLGEALLEQRVAVLGQFRELVELSSPGEGISLLTLTSSGSRSSFLCCRGSGCFLFLFFNWCSSWCGL
mmetsp:Transcript_3190/g.6179  ORF Transcript_3190/g.6179 Transcript_3190/m.6179 type:complete len:297 (-) Transcript_3190:11-901(-)